MACFIVPGAVAVVTTVLRKRFPRGYYIDWLNIMLWGGVVALAVEHIAHQEIVPYPPFLTAGLLEVLPEMLSIGVPMTIFVVIAWAIMVVIANRVKLTEKEKYIAKA